MRIGRGQLWRHPTSPFVNWRFWHGKTLGCYAFILRIGDWDYELSWIDKGQEVDGKII